MNLVPLWLVQLATMLVGMTILFYLPSNLFSLIVLVCAGFKIGDYLSSLGVFFHKKLNGLEDNYENNKQG